MPIKLPKDGIISKPQINPKHTPTIAEKPKLKIVESM
jgi:hypothetical protein